MNNLFRRKKAKLITHSNNFHLDDIFAAASLGILMDGKKIPYEIIRTRDEVLLEKFKYEAKMKNEDSPVFIFDVCGEYDEENNLFDHHQPKGAGKRKNGVEYSSLGLVWKKYGAEICKSSEIADILDERIVVGIDANDTGVDIMAPLQDYNLYNYISFINSFIPNSEKKEDFDYAFTEVVDISKRVLRNEIIKTERKINDSKKFRKYFEKYKNEKVLWVDEKISVPKYFPDNKNILLTVSKKEEGMWILTTTLKQKNSKKSFIRMPKEWGGLRGKELEKVSGIQDVGFCHRGLWLSSAKNKKAAEKMVQKILEKII